jgi:hypothetical protein
MASNTDSLRYIEYIPGRGAVKARTDFHGIEIKWRQPALTYWNCFPTTVHAPNSLINIRPI